MTVFYIHIGLSPLPWPVHQDKGCMMSDKVLDKNTVYQVDMQILYVVLQGQMAYDKR